MVATLVSLVYIFTPLDDSFFLLVMNFLLRYYCLASFIVWYVYGRDDNSSCLPCFFELLVFLLVLDVVHWVASKELLVPEESIEREAGKSYSQDQVEPENRLLKERVG